MSARLEALLGPGTVSRPRLPGPSALLSARYEYVPFYKWGNADRLLKELESWCRGQEEVSARLFYGAGGMGKTRLLIEWSRRLRGEGWRAGFLVGLAAEMPLFEELMESSAERPLLVVIDYAESQQHLSRLLRVVASRRDRGKRGRIRVVLLARAVGDWWDTLHEADVAIGALLSERAPMEVTQLEQERPERWAVFLSAAHAFSRELNHKDYSGPMPKNLMESQFERVLFIHMAALMEVIDPGGSWPNLVEEVLNHEERFWSKMWESASKGRGSSGEGRLFYWECRRLVCALTLVGGAAGRLEASELQERACERRDERMLPFLQDLYPAAEQGEAPRYVGWPEPDLIGEAMVLRALRGESGGAAGWLTHVLAGQAERVVRRGFEVLGRISAEEGEARGWVSALLKGEVNTRAVAALEAAIAVGERTAWSILGDELSSALEREGEAATAARLERVGLPIRTVSLLKVALWVAECLLRHLPSRESTTLLAERARLLNELASRKQALGSTDEAVVLEQESVELYRRLSDSSPEAFLPYLARGLNNLSPMLRHVGKSYEALDSARESVEIRRRLALVNPETSRPLLANSLNTLSNRQGELGRREEALMSAEEAVEIYREFAARSPDTFLPELAVGLGNLGTRQVLMGRGKEALDSMRESVMIRQELTARRPDSYLPDLLSALCNQAGLQSRLGKLEDALASSRQAVKQLQRLRAIHPTHYSSVLAGNLNNLGVILGELGQTKEALALLQEAVDTLRQLKAERPTAFLPDLATSLHNLGVRQFEVGRREEALSALKEAVGIRRQLATRRPEAFHPDLATSLDRLGYFQAMLGSLEQALTAHREAVGIFRNLSTSYPDNFLPALAFSLNNLAIAQGSVRALEDALFSIREAIAIHEYLASLHPEVYIPKLAASLKNLGSVQEAAGSKAAALESVQKALRLLWPWFDRLPEAHARNTGRIFLHLFKLLKEVGTEPSEELLDRLETYKRKTQQSR